MRANVGKLLRGIDRYNPENLATLERYVETQARENAYDLEANLAVLKLYQFNPAYFQTTVTAQILLKALTNLPHTDFTLCKCMIDQTHVSYKQNLEENRELIEGITGFEDSVRKFICHVVGITYQNIEKMLLAEMLGDLTDSQLRAWMSKYGWTESEPGQIFIYNQEENIKPKNIVEKIDFETNCWFLSAVTSLTLHKHLMDKVVPPEQGFDAGYNGKFTFRFWQYGDWQEVEVDDLLPTVDGKLLYLHSGERNEFWSALLEKAYAKLKGGYHNLHVGYPHEAMTDMTGGVTEIFHQENIPADFVRFLRQQLDRGSLVNCASSQGGFEQLSRSGILFQHAYAVTGMEQVQTPEGKVDLVRVRNPWGNTEWNGAWSDEHG
ncbi:EIF3K factor, partial [Polypterus senegalus]